jgi:hypothetical protein
MYEGTRAACPPSFCAARFRGGAHAIGLSRDWERYPDDRIDDYGLSFVWDDTIALPVSLEALDDKPVRTHSVSTRAAGSSSGTDLSAARAGARGQSRTRDRSG